MKPEKHAFDRTLDPAAKRVLELIRESGHPPYEALTPAQARQIVRDSRSLVSPEPPEVATVQDLFAPGVAGPIPLRLYRGQHATQNPMPALVYFHGGGWVFGDLDTHDVVCRIQANGGPFTVISVDYRLAPEHHFPAAVEDAWAATRWIAANACRLGIDPARIAVGGDSAGGNLATVVALTARGQRLALAAQVLFYPVTDLGMRHPSYAKIASGFPVSASTMQWFKNHYLGSVEDQLDWRVSPLRAEDLGGLPPTFLMTAGFDPLRDEGEAYALRLHDAGVKLTYRLLPGQIHGFLTMGRLIPEASAFLDEAAHWLRELVVPAANRCDVDQNSSRPSR
jgi:acetyl esterase